MDLKYSDRRNSWICSTLTEETVGFAVLRPKKQWDLQYSDRKNSEICSTLPEETVGFAVLWPKKQWNLQYSARRNSEICSSLTEETVEFAVLWLKKQWNLQYFDRRNSGICSTLPEETMGFAVLWPKKQWDLQYSYPRNSGICSTLIQETVGFAVLRPKKPWNLQYPDRRSCEICNTLTEETMRFAILWPKKQWNLQYSYPRNSGICSTQAEETVEFAVLWPKKQWLICSTLTKKSVGFHGERSCNLNFVCDPFFLKKVNFFPKLMFVLESVSLPRLLDHKCIFKLCPWRSSLSKLKIYNSETKNGVNLIKIVNFGLKIRNMKDPPTPPQKKKFILDKMTQEYTWILEYIKPFIRLFKCVSFKNDAIKSWSIYLVLFTESKQMDVQTWIGRNYLKRDLF